MQKSIAQVENLEWNPLLWVGISHQTQIKKECSLWLFYDKMWKEFRENQHLQGKNPHAVTAVEDTTSFIQHEIKISSWRLYSAMAFLWLMRKSSQNPPKILLKLWGETKNTLWPRKGPLVQLSRHLTKPQLCLPHILYGFSWKPIDKMTCRPADCFELHPQRRKTEMECSFGSLEKEEC